MFWHIGQELYFESQSASIYARRIIVRDTLSVSHANIYSLSNNPILGSKKVFWHIGHELYLESHSATQR